MMLMSRFRIMLVITLSIIIGLMSPPGISVNAEDDLTSQENDLELTSVYMNKESIPLKDTGDNPDKTIRYSVKFRGKDCYLMLVPAPQVNDPIGIAAPNINDDIGITGELSRNSKNVIIKKSGIDALDE